MPRRQPGLEQSCTAVLDIARKLVVLGRKKVVHAEVGRLLEYLLDVILRSSFVVQRGVTGGERHQSRAICLVDVL